MFKGMNYVYAVYKEGGFKNAAEKLHVSQPSLSASVRRVEEKIGYPIFDRSVRPLKLTECGEKYIQTIENIAQLEEQFEAYVNDLGDLKSGSLRLAGTSIATSFIYPQIIKNYSALYPMVDIELTEGTSESLTRMVTSGEFDLIIDYGIEENELLESKVISEDYLVLSVPKNFKENAKLKEYQISYEDIKSHAFTKSSFKTVPLDAFKNEPFVLLKNKNITRILSDKYFERFNMKPEIVFESAQQMTAYFANRRGIGCAFVSSTLISGMPKNDDCVYYKLDKDISIRHLAFFWKKGRYVTKAMDEFMRMTLEMCK